MTLAEHTPLTSLTFFFSPCSLYYHHECLLASPQTCQPCSYLRVFAFSLLFLFVCIGMTAPSPPSELYTKISVKLFLHILPKSQNTTTFPTPDFLTYITNIYFTFKKLIKVKSPILKRTIERNLVHSQYCASITFT
jgi:hypothetical protein